MSTIHYAGFLTVGLVFLVLVGIIVYNCTKKPKNIE